LIFLSQAFVAVLNFDADVDVEIEEASLEQKVHPVLSHTKKVTQIGEIPSTKAGAAGLIVIETLRDGEQAAWVRILLQSMDRVIRQSGTSR